MTSKTKNLPLPGLKNRIYEEMSHKPKNIKFRTPTMLKLTTGNSKTIDRRRRRKGGGKERGRHFPFYLRYSLIQPSINCIINEFSVDTTKKPIIGIKIRRKKRKFIRSTMINTPSIETARKAKPRFVYEFVKRTELSVLEKTLSECAIFKRK